jgi:hypothetical protein
MPVILAIQKTEIRRIVVRSQTREIVFRSPVLKIPNTKMAQVVEPCKCVLNSNPSPTKNKTKQKTKTMGERLYFKCIDSWDTAST